MRVRLLLKLIVAPAIVYAALALFALTLSDRLIFPAPSPHYGDETPSIRKIPYGAGEIAAAWLPHPESPVAFLYLHGNGEDLGMILPALRELCEKTGCAVLAVDYPGYGLSRGAPSEEGCVAAGEAGLVWLGEHGFPVDKVVVFGRSLGTGPAVAIAAREKVKGVILHSPFLSVYRLVTGVRVLPFDRFDSYSKIGAVTCPLFIAHGDFDSVVPFSHGESLFAGASRSPKKTFLRLPRAGHNDPVPPSAAPLYWTQVRRLAESE